MNMSADFKEYVTRPGATCIIKDCKKPGKIYRFTDSTSAYFRCEEHMPGQDLRSKLVEVPINEVIVDLIMDQ